MSKRTEQVADELRRVIGEVIQFELKDPRVGFVTVTRVDVSADLQHARAFVSVLGDDAARDEALVGLEKARGFVRRRVGQELRHMRVVPDVQFRLDTSLDYSIRIADVLREVDEERRSNPPRFDASE
jgi:ribosome-binding factor A